MNYCRECSKVFDYTPELRKKGYRKSLCNSCSVTLARRRRKQKAIDYKGGCCQVCGYNKYNGALHFHHIKPDHKDFAFSAKGIPRTWEAQKVELDKCTLLCSNCHSETHAGLLDIH